MSLIAYIKSKFALIPVVGSPQLSYMEILASSQFAWSPLTQIYDAQKQLACYACDLALL
jgi:hypothetical protein